MSKAKLLFDLILYVNAKRQFTAQDVANEFHLSLRTAHRYLSELGEMGVPIYAVPGRSGGFRVLDNRLLPPVLFRENEVLSVFFAFQALKYYASLPFDIDIASVSNKLRANLPPDTRKKIDRLGEVISFWNIKRSVPSPHLKDIIEAAAENRVVIIDYESKSGNFPREVAPLGIFSYDGFWYMPAFEFARHTVKLFRTDRIGKLRKLERTHSPEMTLHDWLHRYTEQKPNAPVRLYVELTREGCRQCRSQPWLEPHIVVNNRDLAHIDTIIDRTEIEFVSRYFFQLGTAAKVMEPREVVHRICELSRELLEHYG